MSMTPAQLARRAAILRYHAARDHADRIARYRGDAGTMRAPRTTTRTLTLK